MDVVPDASRYAAKIIWNNDHFSKYHAENHVLIPKFSSYKFFRTPQNADSEFVDSIMTKILSYHSIDDRVSQLIVMGTNELVENGVKHVYNFKKEVDKNDIFLLGINISPSFMHTYLITKSAPVNYEAISAALTENNPLKFTGNGRGFMMMKKSFDMLYINETPNFLEFGSVKLFH